MISGGRWLGRSKEDCKWKVDSCRIKRNTVEYDYIGGATDADADELIKYIKELKKDVLDWLDVNKPEYLST